MHTLSDSQLAAIVREAIEKAASHDNQKELPKPATPLADLLTVHQLCGIFNKDRRAVEKYGITRVTLGPGDYRYDPKDVQEFIEGRKERP